NEMLEQRVDDRTRELGLALAEAERANASKTRFVAAASHDLLQPLSAAKLFVTSISEQANPIDARSVTKKAEMALNSVEQFIAALLDISKLDADQAVFEVQPLRLADIFTPLRNELMPLAQQKGIDMRIVDCDLTVESDPGYLRRIVQNLLTNAIRYTDQGRVLVGVRRTKNAARIEVWDTGRGIAQKDQQTIFREFERLSPDNSDTGLGLGLAIVERACKGLDHPLSLWSEPGLGSCFSLNVPIRKTNGPEATLQDAGITIAPPQLSGRLLMLVEDNSQLAQAMTAMIEGFGTTVIHAHTAEEALDILGEIQLVPDALLVDYQLGSGQTGTQFLSEIFRRFGPVPAAIIFAERTRNLREACKDLGTQLFTKPIEKNRLHDLLVDLFQDKFD
ncbi:MAG: hybrid sensor histidine kinase/response regulator, partial [Sulfitobacter sp.]